MVPRRLTAPRSFSLPIGMAALEAHLVAALVARHIHFHPFRQGIDHRGAHAMQAARGLIDLAVEFAAGMQRGHDHFQRRLVLEFGMRIDRNAAAIVADGQHVAGLQAPSRCGWHGRPPLRPSHCRGFPTPDDAGGTIGAADIHAGAAAHRLQPFQHLDVLGGIGLGAGGRGGCRTGRVRSWP